MANLDDKPMWAADRIVAPTLDLAITIPATANEFAIKVQTPGSGISILLAVGTPSTGSGNLYCQWELSPGSGNALQCTRSDVASFVSRVSIARSGS
uniref:Uncharacterized protein n=1 Tax=Tanacetum cinerariifolium TaxID=118510 RepID=A0A6L2M889_TANCI|nr:hypothetical protein [Tanacetum cinerariifolium]